MNVGEAHRFFTQLKPAGAKDQVASLILDDDSPPTQLSGRRRP